MRGLDTISIIFIIFVVLIVIWIQLRYLMDEVEPKLLFHPTNQFLPEPPLKKEEIILPSGVHGWLFNNHPNSPTVLYCHGNAFNVSYWDNMINMIDSQKVNLFIFDYHGFGQSPGKPSAKQCLEDGLEAYDFLAKKVEADSIILIGESFGGAVALTIANQRQAKALVLLATFSRPIDVARELDMHVGIKFMASLKEELNNALLIKQVHIPVVIVHSEEDEIIPYPCAVELYRNITHNCKRLITISGKHSKPKLRPEDLAEIFDFCGIDCGYCELAKPHLCRIENDNRRKLDFSQVCQ